MSMEVNSPTKEVKKIDTLPVESDFQASERLDEDEEKVDSEVSPSDGYTDNICSSHANHTDLEDDSIGSDLIEEEAVLEEKETHESH